MKNKKKIQMKLKRFTRQFDRSFLVFILALFSRQAVRAIYKPYATSQIDRAGPGSRSTIREQYGEVKITHKRLSISRIYKDIPAPTMHYTTRSL